MKIIYLALALLPLTAGAANVEILRQQFLPHYRAAVDGVPPPLSRLGHLRDYPLYTYLTYYQLRPRLRTLPVAEVRAFLQQNTDSLLADRLRTDWLRETARVGRWDLFADDYLPQSDPELQCHAAAIQIKKSEFDAAFAAAKSLWLIGKSQDSACDVVFAAMRARGALTDQLIFARMLLAARAGNTALAQHIAKRYAPSSDQALAKLLAHVHANPTATLQLVALKPDTSKHRALVGHGLSRLARQQVTAAYVAWLAAKKRYQFTAEEAGIVQRALAVAAVAQTNSNRLEQLDDIEPIAVDELIERLRLREGLKARRWDKLARWTAEPPRGVKTNKLAWRYWHARALEMSGQGEQATQQYQTLATERDYYGFLASDKLGQPYTMTHRPVAPDINERARITALGDIQRAAEFYRLGMRAQANAELNFLFAGSSTRDIEIVAVLVAEWGWHERAIAILGQIQSYDDLDLRFPLLHRELVEKFAKQRGLTPALVYSIIRGESAFVVDARSSAGALGLMQLMPATGDATAKRLGLRLNAPSELTKIDKNIAIGSEYLRQVLRQFNSSFPLAAAAYNAGPSRVRAWLKASDCIPPDVWVETIPFAETEAYVRRALFYAAVYEYRLGEAINTLETRLADLTTNLPGKHQCAPNSLAQQ